MSLLSRIQAAQAQGIEVGRRQASGIEGVRVRAKARLLERATKLTRISRDEELASVWGDVLSRIERNHRLEKLGDYS
jgi:hypothetical protein